MQDIMESWAQGPMSQELWNIDNDPLVGAATQAAALQLDSNEPEELPAEMDAHPIGSPRLSLVATQPLEAASCGLKVRAQGSLCVHRMPALRALRASPCMRANFTHSALAPCS